MDSADASECALFSNIAAMALMLVKGSTMSAAQSDTLCQIGIDASEVCISLHEYISAATMAKSCECTPPSHGGTGA